MENRGLEKENVCVCVCETTKFDMCALVREIDIPNKKSF